MAAAQIYGTTGTSYAGALGPNSQYGYGSSSYSPYQSQYGYGSSPTAVRPIIRTRRVPTEARRTHPTEREAIPPTRNTGRDIARNSQSPYSSYGGQYGANYNPYGSGYSTGLQPLTVDQATVMAQDWARATVMAQDWARASLGLRIGLELRLGLRIGLELVYGSGLGSSFG
ncbi:hypothetical protein BV898_15067 [Hypsibius exemplaris]|uniref:Uncharacterized protein n=1 Tax=Hypsibius exemplaris TaxID=2072580 RepID=A0A9X6RKC6_HYPEX|nr:hypothetical protein BV898_15067 [Hypsibius exemplaris]